jgi:hypothetical protein
MTEPSLQTTDKSPASVNAARALFFLMGAVWLLFGLITLLSNPTTAWVVALFRFINAGLLFLIGWGVGKQIQRYYYFGILFIVANIFLTVIEEIDLFGLTTLALDLILLVLLLLTRSRYAAAK